MVHLIDNAEYRRWVSEHECRWCKSQVDIGCHHLKGVGGKSGMSIKATDQLTTSLCPGCHRDLHSGKHPEIVLAQWEMIALTEARFIGDLARATGPNFGFLVRKVALMDVIGGRARR